MTNSALAEKMRALKSQGEDIPDELMEALLTARLREKDCMDKVFLSFFCV